MCLKINIQYCALHAIYSTVHFTLYTVLCTSRYIQYCALHAMHSTQYTARNTQHAMHSTHYRSTARNTQHAIHSTQYTARNTQHAIHSTQYTARSTQHAIHSTQYTVLYCPFSTQSRGTAGIYGIDPRTLSIHPLHSLHPSTRSPSTYCPSTSSPIGRLFLYSNCLLADRRSVVENTS